MSPVRANACIFALASVLSPTLAGFAQAAPDGDTPKSDPRMQIVGRSLEGRPIECLVLGDGEDVFWLIATIHGNEAAGTPLSAKFIEWLDAHPEELEGRRVIVMPVANPDGMAENIRYNKNGVDLNRNFPAGNFDAEQKVHGPTPLSEPESRALMRVLVTYFPDRIVTIHQPLDCMDWDGEKSKRMAQAMAEKSPLPFKQVGSRPGSLGSFVGLMLDKPIVTMELPQDAGMDGEALWKEHGESLIAALRYQDKGEAK
jgi:murein peptide amidase A